jgi:hypothetical protein
VTDSTSSDLDVKPKAVAVWHGAVGDDEHRVAGNIDGK